MQAEIRYVRIAQYLGRAALCVLCVSTAVVAFAPVALSDSAPHIVSLVGLIGSLGYPLAGALAIAMRFARLAHALGASTTTSVRDGSLLVVGARRRYELRPEQLMRGTVVAGGVSIDDVHGRELRLPMQPAVARRMLDDLGIGAGNRRYEWRVRSWTGIPGAALGALAGLAVALGAANTGATWFAGSIGAVCCPTFAWVGAWLARGFFDMRIVVGFDGVHVRTVRREHVLRYADVARLDDTAGRFDVTLRDGWRWSTPWRELDAPVAQAVRSRIAEAYERAREHRMAPVVPERPREAGAYRTADVNDQRLREGFRDVLNSPLTTDATRLDAARALATDAEDRARLALVAGAVASPTLRRQLLTLARSEPA